MDVIAGRAVPRGGLRIAASLTRRPIERRSVAAFCSNHPEPCQLEAITRGEGVYVRNHAVRSGWPYKRGVTPWDAGMRLESGEVGVRHLAGHRGPLGG